LKFWQKKAFNLCALLVYTEGIEYTTGHVLHFSRVHGRKLQ